MRSPVFNRADGTRAVMDSETPDIVLLVFGDNDAVMGEAPATETERATMLAQQASEQAATDAEAAAAQAEAVHQQMKDLTDEFIAAAETAYVGALHGQAPDTEYHDELAQLAIEYVYAMKSLPTTQRANPRLLEQRADMMDRALGLVHVEKRWLEGVVAHLATQVAGA